MKFMKKIFAILAALVVLVIIISVFSNSEKSGEPSPDNQQENRSTENDRSHRNTEAKPSADVEPPLLVIGWNWRTEHGHAIVEGEVKNVSKRRIKNVEAVVKFYTDDKQFITSGNAIIEYNPILPGQSSPFKVYATYNPRMNSASLSFKHLMGGTIAYKRKKSPPLPPPSSVMRKDLKPHQIDAAVTAVDDSIQEVRKYKWQAGPLKNGIAVLIDEAVAYWVDADGKVHAANGIAKAWSPGVPYSPIGIDFDSVKAAACK